MANKVVCTNRKARHEFEIIDTIEAGIVLHGFEVKSLRDSKVSLDGSFAVVENDEVWLLNCFIDEYTNRSTWGIYQPTRKRKLLLKKSEIRKFAQQASIKGFTLVPLSIYFKDGRAKIELSVCRGKQLHDKREALKKRDSERDMRFS
jgi:SsrA-binding protein